MDTISIDRLVASLKEHISRIADDCPEWVTDRAQDSAIITGLTIAGQVACVQAYRDDLGDDLRRHAQAACARIRRRKTA